MVSGLWAMSGPSACRLSRSSGTAWSPYGRHVGVVFKTSFRQLGFQFPSVFYS